MSFPPIKGQKHTLFIPLGHRAPFARLLAKSERVKTMRRNGTKRTVEENKGQGVETHEQF